jgi:hypothetical protein
VPAGQALSALVEPGEHPVVEGSQDEHDANSRELVRDGSEQAFYPGGGQRAQVLAGQDHEAGRFFAEQLRPRLLTLTGGQRVDEFDRSQSDERNVVLGQDVSAIRHCILQRRGPALGQSDVQDERAVHEAPDSLAHDGHARSIGLWSTTDLTARIRGPAERRSSLS